MTTAMRERPKSGTGIVLDSSVDPVVLAKAASAKLASCTAQETEGDLLLSLTQSVRDLALVDKAALNKFDKGIAVDSKSLKEAIFDGMKYSGIVRAKLGNDESPIGVLVAAACNGVRAQLATMASIHFADELKGMLTKAEEAELDDAIPSMFDAAFGMIGLAAETFGGDMQETLDATKWLTTFVRTVMGCILTKAELAKVESWQE